MTSLKSALVTKTCDVIKTDEYLSTKLCSICGSRLWHPYKVSNSGSGNKKKKNLGLVKCINPNCIERLCGNTIRGRDSNAATNIRMIGLHKLVTGKHLPLFDRSIFSDLASSSDQVYQYFFGLQGCVEAMELLRLE